MAADAREAALEIMQKVATNKIDIDFGLELFDQHDSGIKIGQDGLAVLAEAARALKDLPSWTVILEGHCPGRPNEKDALRESVGEEAADLCKAYLQEVGILNDILCKGRCSVNGAGMCVQMSTQELAREAEGPQAFAVVAKIEPVHATFGDTQTVGFDEQSDNQPSFERAETEGLLLRAETQPFAKAEASTWNLQDDIRQVEQKSRLEGVEQPRGSTPELVAPQPDSRWAETTSLAPVLSWLQPKAEKISAKAETISADDFVGSLRRSMTQRITDDDFQVPDTSNLSMEEKRKALNELLDKVLETNIAFEPNKAEIHRQSNTTVRQIAKVIVAFPDSFTLKCVGHSKGRPAENNEAKQQLSQARAEAVKEALLAEGVQNEVKCASYGSALGRGMSVKINALTPAELEDGEVHIPDCSDLSKDQQEASLNQLLQEALEQGLAFEPNNASIQEAGAPVVRRVGNILKAFPDFAVRCEGHAKGQASDNSDAKRQLSQVRAEAIRAAAMALGVTNSIVCVGMGSSHGLGMCVRIFASDPDKEDIKIPDLAGMSESEKEQLLNSLLERALDRNIDFEPNKSNIPPGGNIVIHNLSTILMAFSDFTLCCESHTKGLASENSDAKRKLSYTRAEAVKTAVLASGATNYIVCRGAGSSQGLGMRTKMFTIDPEELKKDEIVVPDVTGMTAEEQAVLLDKLLEKALQKNIEFEPNVFEIPSMGAETIRAVANVLREFPGLAIRCEGHAKGQPSDNTEAKIKLSYMRAEAVKAAVKQLGIENGIHCVGEGCAQGLGMRVRMFVIDASELTKDDVVIPEEVGQSREERARMLNKLLAKALEKSINFEPNKAEIQAVGMDVVVQLSRVLKAFPEFTVSCEGHTKGKPADNNDAKMRLSQVRAEAVSAALKKDGVENEFVCMGRGSEQGLGMCVRMYTEEAA